MNTKQLTKMDGLIKQDVIRMIKGCAMSGDITKEAANSLLIEIEKEPVKIVIDKCTHIHADIDCKFCS